MDLFWVLQNCLPIKKGYFFQGKADNFFETGVNWPVNENRNSLLKNDIQRSIRENRPFLRYPDGI
jgi:hypothetical protein